jgi:hypothetical protein
LRDIESSDELDIANVIAAEFEVHDSRNRRSANRAAIEFDTLGERRGAVSNSDDRDPDARHEILLVQPRNCTQCASGGEQRRVQLVQMVVRRLR